MLHQLKQCNLAIFSGCETRSLVRKGFVEKQGAGEILSVREEQSANGKEMKYQRDGKNCIYRIRRASRK